MELSGAVAETTLPYAAVYGKSKKIKIKIKNKKKKAETKVYCPHKQRQKENK